MFFQYNPAFCLSLDSSWVTIQFLNKTSYQLTCRSDQTFTFVSFPCSLTSCFLLAVPFCLLHFFTIPIHFIQCLVFRYTGIIFCWSHCSNDAHSTAMRFWGWKGNGGKETGLVIDGSDSYTSRLKQSNFEAVLDHQTTIGIAIETHCCVPAGNTNALWSRLSKNFMHKGGGVTRYSVDYFMSHSTETFVGEPFSVSLISSIEKFYAQEGYITIFYRKFFVSQYRKIS